MFFDLDETLVHCIEDIGTTPYDLKIHVQSDNEMLEAGINLRPHTYECLRSAQKNYMLIIFTASHRSYADVVVDKLEAEFRKMEYLTDEEQAMLQYNPQELKRMKKNQRLFDHRLYREHCHRTAEGVHIKDLSIVDGIDMRQAVIVDNCVHSFGFQLNNGIPIIPYYSEESNRGDEELLHLSYYLTCIAESDDVRVQNKKAF